MQSRASALLCVSKQILVFIKEEKRDEDMSTVTKKSRTNIFGAIGRDVAEIGRTFREGDWKVRLSFLIMGFAQICRRQFARGIAFLAGELVMLWFIFGFGWQYLSKIGTLGVQARITNPNGTVTYGDNSFFILLYGIMTIFGIFFLILLWRLNVRDNYRTLERLRQGKKLPTNEQDFATLLDGNFDKTLLALPMLGVFLFVVLPIVFMICVAFTNYDYDHQPPSRLFEWVGWENFKALFSMQGSGSYGTTFLTVLLWTLVWAFFATFLTYFLGMAVAMLINRKGIKFKKMWRTILVMTIAVPQFVSLLYVGKMFAADGLVNTYLLKWGWIDEAIPFWTDATHARILVVLINLWVGIPYCMLIVTGILMNIPSELYESARIDGANAWQTFRSITLPYMMFVTGPYLLSQFIGNLNNFNVIYLLTGGKPQSMNLSGGAGYTDLLVTWLYKMTVNDTNYKMASVLGIMVFVVTAVISLIVYNRMGSVRDEEGFQ